jgi:cytochrome P450
MPVGYPLDTPVNADEDCEGLRLLEKGPLARALFQGRELWLALGYQAVRQVLSDPRFSREEATRPGGPVTNQTGANPALLLSMDPPRHTRIRHLMAKAFSPRTVADLEPRIEELVDGLLDELVAGPRPGDLVAALAAPLPILVICELLGVPVADRAKIRDWAGRLMAVNAYTPEQITEATGQIDAYLNELIEVKRAEPDDALISQLIAANDEGGHLSAAELTSNVQMLVVAGHETTVGQIGNFGYTLLRHPDQAALLAAHPGLLPQAVTELMRYCRLTDTATPRVAVADVDVCGVEVRAGEAVIPMLAAANRDPEAYPDPHRLDFTREGPAPHLGLGHGTHYCLGAPLAELELRIALGSLLSRFPTLAAAIDLADAQWRVGYSVRGLIALPVTW